MAVTWKRIASHYPRGLCAAVSSGHLAWFAAHQDPAAIAGSADSEGRGLARETWRANRLADAAAKAMAAPDEQTKQATEMLRQASALVKHEAALLGAITTRACGGSGADNEEGEKKRDAAPPPPPPPPDDGDKAPGPKKGFDPSSGRDFRTLTSESLDNLSLTGIQRASALATLAKAELPKHHPPPLWPGLGDILDTSGASVKNQSSS